MRALSRFLSPIVLALVAAACAESVATSPPALPPDLAPLTELRCAGDARAQTLTCAPAAVTRGGVRRVIVGGQNHYVRLTSSGTTYDGGTDVLSSYVNVQNLLLEPMGTTDGLAADGQGVRVFFASGPTNGVTLANASGVEAFTASNQPYYLYLPELDGGILRPGLTSAAKTWRFAMNGALSFTFVVYVQAATPAGGTAFVHFAEVTTGDKHSCGLTPGGLVYCWGSDFSGQRGDGLANGPQRIATPVPMPGGALVKQVASGLNYSCAVTTAGTAYCWGNAPGFYHLGSPGGNQLIPTRLDVPAGVSFTSIGGGASHACGLGSDGAAYCWGYDGVGQLGNGADRFEHDTATQVVMPSGVRFTSLSVGGQTTCAIGDNHRAYCWGYGDFGQLGVGVRIYGADAPVLVALPPFEVGFASIAAGDYHTCAIALSGTTYCWGDDSKGELGDGPSVTPNQYGPSAVAAPPGVTFTQIYLRVQMTCAVASNGSAYCWGDDLAGALGNGPTTAAQESPALVLAPAGVFFTGIQTGGIHTCASSTGPTYCWGLSYWGAIGDGAETNRDQPVAVAGTR